MKVLHVIRIIGIGGAEKLLLQLLPAQNQKITAECAIFHKDGDEKAAGKIGEELRNRGVKTYIFGYKKVYEKAIRKKILDILDAGHYDLVHSHLKYADAWLAWLKFRGRLRLPVISTMHGYNDTYENEYGFVVHKKLYRSSYFILSKWIFRQLDGFILISNVISRFFHETSLIKAQPTVVIYHGYEKTSDPGWRENKEGEFHIALPGRLIKRKGQLYAIESVAVLLKDHKEVTLHLFGEGPDRPELEAVIEEKQLSGRVLLHGYVHGLTDRLKEMDVIVIPSLWEGFGIVFLDAFAAGVPVVSFDLPASNEIIRDRSNGLLAVPYSAESLTAAISQLYDNPRLRQRLAEQAFKELNGRFSLEQMVTAYIDFYNVIYEKRVQALQK